MAREQEEAILRITACYVADVQAGRQPRLSEYLARYPEYASAIVDFVAYYHAIEVHVPVGIETHQPLSHVSQEVLQRVQEQVLPQPIKRIDTLLIVDGRSLTLPELADQLNLSVDIVIQLEQRMIKPATIPYELLRRVAMVLQRPVSVIETYFRLHDRSQDDETRHGERQSLRVAEGQARYPSDARKQSFRRALEASSLLSSEQYTSWSTILKREML